MKAQVHMLEEIQAPVVAEMEEFNRQLSECYKSDNPFIEQVVDYVLSRRGKQMRPLLVLLSAALNGGIQPSTYTGAILVEMTHTASLVHDDVIDEAYIRRGQLSVNAVWRSHAAVLIGDYVLARSVAHTCRQGAFELMNILSEAFEKLSEGELIQLHHTSKLDMTEETYYGIIYRKTASLLEAAAGIGAKSAGADDEAVANMKLFGKCIGMAFQMKDDLLDYQPSAETGKATGNDLKERKITLPLLYLLNNSDPSERKALIRKISTVRDNEADIAYIQRRVIESGAVAYTENKMEEFKKQALDVLSAYPDSAYREALELYCRFILERKK